MSVTRKIFRLLTLMVLLLSLRVLELPALGQIVDLSFANNVQATNATNPAGLALGPYYTGLFIDFTNVATVGGTQIDMRATAAVYGSGYTFDGHLPNYSQATGQPSGDIGLMYEANRFRSGGMTYDLNFYTHGSNFTTPYTLTGFKLMVYDIDGEAGQTEKLQVYNADGFTTYQLPSNAGGPTATVQSTGVTFNGGGVNLAETDPSGAVILTYLNTSHVTLNLIANTTSGTTPNPVFTAIDGDLSLIGGNTSTFQPPVTVPEPASALCVMAAGLLLLLKRSRWSRVAES